MEGQLKPKELWKLLWLPVYAAMFVLVLMAAFWITSVVMWAAIELIKDMLTPWMMWL